MKAICEAKIQARGITIEDRRAQRDERSERAKLGYIVAKRRREEGYRRSIELRGIPYSNDPSGVGMKYVNRTWKRGEKRMKLEEVLETELRHHYFNKHSGYYEIIDWRREMEGVLYPESLASIRFFAEKCMELFWPEFEWDDKGITCSCGKRNSKDSIVRLYKAINTPVVQY